MAQDKDAKSQSPTSIMNDPKKASLPENAHIEVAAGSLTTETGIDDLPISMFVWLVAFTASIAGMLFGYDTGIISAVLVYIHDGLDNRTLTSNEKELITSLCSGGAFFGSILAGLTADKVSTSICHFVIETIN